jgi:nucleoside-diphosphate-sugar epimerase
MIRGEKILVTGVHGAVAFPLAKALAAENEG